MASGPKSPGDLSPISTCNLPLWAVMKRASKPGEVIVETESTVDFEALISRFVFGSVDKQETVSRGCCLDGVIASYGARDLQFRKMLMFVAAIKEVR